MNPHRLATELLIAQPGSRTLIPTPAAVLDLDAFEANVALMASRAQAAGLARDAAYLIRPDSYVALAEPSGAHEALERYGAEHDVDFRA